MANQKRVAAKKAVVRPFEDGSFYIHTGSTGRVKYGRNLDAAMRSLAKLSSNSRGRVR